MARICPKCIFVVMARICPKCIFVVMARICSKCIFVVMARICPKCIFVVMARICPKCIFVVMARICHLTVISSLSGLASLSKAMVPVLVLLFVALWFILRGDLLYVFPCVILFLCFSVLFVLRLPRLRKRDLILVLFLRLFDLCLFRFVGFLFLLGSGKGCDHMPRSIASYSFLEVNSWQQLRVLNQSCHNIIKHMAQTSGQNTQILYTWLSSIHYKWFNWPVSKTIVTATWPSSLKWVAKHLSRENELLTYAPNEESNQPSHLRNLIRVFVFNMKKVCLIDYRSASSEDSDPTAWMRKLI